MVEFHTRRVEYPTRLGKPAYESRRIATVWIIGSMGTMANSTFSLWVHLLAASALLYLCAANGYAEEFSPGTEGSQAKSWAVGGEIGGPNDLSGLACSAKDPNVCLMASDEVRSVQCFRTEPGKPSRLVAGHSLEVFASGDEFDAEGVAHAYGNFYIVGSHGLSRKERLQPNRFHIARIPDAACGDDEAVRGRAIAEITLGSVSTAISNRSELAPYYRKPLASNGLNIEAIAVRDERVYLGLRAPCIDGRAPIMIMPVSAPFTGPEHIAAKRAALTWLSLGEDTGIRDLASVSAGLLVLTGNASPDTDPKEPADSRAAIHFWDLKSPDTSLLARLPGTTSKPEGLLVLAEEYSKFRVLVVSDSAENGKPFELTIPAPRPAERP